jgi:hypothetical protein
MNYIGYQSALLLQGWNSLQVNDCAAQCTNGQQANTGGISLPPLITL